jgi:catechol 2,3-dioxygenase-like lactoylglutathione lyase family enzyme
MPLSRLDHVLVLTDDLAGSRDFYRDLLGLVDGERPSLEFPGHWLYAGGAPCVHLAEREPYLAHARTLGLAPVSPQAAGSGTVDHIAFLAPDYEATLERLAAAGVRAVPNTVPGAGIRQLFVQDPNGVTLEINLPPA